MHCGAEVTESSTNKQHHLSAADDEADAGRPDGFAVGAPMWDLERTRARVAASWPQVTPRNSTRRVMLTILNGLAAELVRQQEAGVAWLVFERALARDGKPMSLLGCHRLEVTDAHAFLTAMEAWFQNMVRVTASGALTRFGNVSHKPSRRVLTVLKETGLRVRGKRYRAAVDARVDQHEPLWHSAYWAW